jgi:hypothetical protein
LDWDFDVDSSPTPTPLPFPNFSPPPSPPSPQFPPAPTAPGFSPPANPYSQGGGISLTNMNQSSLYDTITSTYGSPDVDTPEDYSDIVAEQDEQADDILTDIGLLGDKGRQILDNFEDLYSAASGLFDSFSPQFPTIVQRNLLTIQIPVLGSFTLDGTTLTGVSYLRAVFSLFIWLMFLVLAVKIVRSAIA